MTEKNRDYYGHPRYLDSCDPFTMYRTLRGEHWDNMTDFRAQLRDFCSVKGWGFQWNKIDGREVDVMFFPRKEWARTPATRELFEQMTDDVYDIPVENS